MLGEYSTNCAKNQGLLSRTVEREERDLNIICEKVTDT